MADQIEPDSAPSSRSIGPPPDPLGQPPRSDISPNDNTPPVGSVGPNVPPAGDPSAQDAASGGFGATHVMYDQAYPPGELSAMPWAGWPVQWDTPNTTSLGSNVAALGGADLDAVFACVDLNARTFADMPAYVTRKGYLQPDPSWLVNPQPEVYAGGWREFAKQVWVAWQVVGEAFVVATSRFASGLPRTFVMVNPLLVNAELIGGQPRYFINGVDATEDVCHIKYLGWPDDAHGHGPLETAGARILATKALARYGADLAVNGGIPWAVLQSKYRITAGQADRIRSQWISAARNRRGAPAVLDQDLTLQQLMVTPKDMALSEQLAWNESRLAVLLGVPPYLVGLPSGSDSLTYANVSAIFDHHWRAGLKPGGNTIMGALSLWALPAGQVLNLNAQSYIRPAPTDRASYYKQLFDMGAITVDEIRRNEGLEPLGIDPTDISSSTEAEGVTKDDPTVGAI